jgi:FkbH-like protein
MDASNPEPVRLLVWDLDETFWHGTLTEGGMTYRRDCHDIVIELARRGIVSSICSKNDHVRVQEILEREGIWEYFVFPSINWDPKGPRLAALVETIGLRAPTIMLVDDNPMNLAEARHYAAGMQVAAETIIPAILDNPLFRGKSDPDMTRLAQYKLLEKRRADEAQSSGDNAGFLRESGIVVTISHDLEPHLDRVVELINRTNQLNFTKQRLPEDPDAARQELRSLLSQYTVQAGIVRVRDNYGDYGYCGLYIMTSGQLGRKMRHFCFSCRILNMGVETWLYNRLGRPSLKIRGEVLTDVLRDDRDIDWISAELPETAMVIGSDDAPKLDYVFARGGCDLHAIQHYFTVAVGALFGEFNIVEGGLNLPLQHSSFARHRLRGLPPDAAAAFHQVGYRDEHFQSALADVKPDATGVWVLSFWADAGNPLYRHRASGLSVPVPIPGVRVMFQDVSRMDPAESGADPKLISYLRDHFDYVGMISEAEFKENVRVLLDSAGPNTKIFILMAHEKPGQRGQEAGGMTRKQITNHWITEITAGLPGVTLMDIGKFSSGVESGPGNANHFDRITYFRVFQEIMRNIREESPPATQASAA